MSKKFFVVDYIEQGLHTSEVTRSITKEFTDIAEAGWLKRLPEKWSLALLAMAMVPPVRWILSLVGPDRDLFAIILKGPTYLVYNAPYFLLGRGKRSAWITDTWPNRDKRLLLLVKVLRLNPVFVSYRESAERLKKLAPHVDWIYVPEALPTDDYPNRPQNERGWDVITFGRKYMEHHEALKQYNAEGQIRYRFTDDGSMVAETHRDLLEALANSRVSICVPRAITHSHAGGVNAMTMRYLQSIACGCVVMGETPSEMLNLFGYNPVVKADLEQPVTQLEQMFADWGPYHQLIERNLEEVRSRHLWKHRAEYIVATLRDQYGYRIGNKVPPEAGQSPVPSAQAQLKS